MINVQDFVREVRRIADSRPTYRTGGSGADGTCDCIGLIMGAMYGCGHKAYDLHSSNYFARFQTESLCALSAVDQLAPGMVVYKARNGTDKLNARYLQGGRCFNGDLLDYYHVGVVTGLDPLEITHCTSTGNVNGIAHDTSINGWDLYGQLADVEYDVQAENAPAQTEAPGTVELAIVYSENDDPVRLRKTPTTTGEYNTLEKVPKGAQVEVLESDGVWSTVRWNGQRGYMMNQFLRVIGMAPVEPEPEGITITLSLSIAAELLNALRKAGVG